MSKPKPTDALTATTDAEPFALESEPAEKLRKLKAVFNQADYQTIEQAITLKRALNGIVGGRFPRADGEAIAAIVAEWLTDTANAIREKREEA